jgi:TPR repeat protein
MWEHKMKHFVVLILLFTCVACNPYINPVTTGPAVALGIYEQTQKRDRWHEYAAKGDVYAQFALAESYCCNITDGGRDFAKSFKWYCTAGESGYAKAQVRLGKIYHGVEPLGEHVVVKDNARAYLWYTLAARRANGEAMDLKKDLLPQMTKQELADGKYLVSHRKKVPCDEKPLEWIDK